VVGSVTGFDEQQITALTRRTRRRTGGFAVLVVVVMFVGSLLTAHPRHSLTPGAHMPSFAVPSARGSLPGDANIAPRANEGSAGSRPACAVRGSEIVNICELEESGPVVLSLFVNRGDEPEILTKMQALAREFPSVQFVGVGVGGSRSSLRSWLRSKGVTLAVGYDHDGAVAALYDMLASEIVFSARGGIVQSEPLYGDSSLTALRQHTRELIASAQAAGTVRPQRAAHALAGQS
jgi:hypothetical protein